MKKIILAFSVISSAIALSSCAVSTTTNSSDYNGYTVGYNGGNVNDYYGGYNGYAGYGGWSSNYYAPGYRYNSNYWPRGSSYGGMGYYRSGYAGRGWRR